MALLSDRKLILTLSVGIEDTSKEEYKTSSQYFDDLSSEGSAFSECDSCDETDIIGFLSMTVYEYLYDEEYSENKIAEQIQFKQTDLLKPIHTKNLEK